jgi:hypothetical protein
MISRRPKSRASTENAPGPSPRTVTSVVNPRMIVVLGDAQLCSVVNRIRPSKPGSL